MPFTFVNQQLIDSSQELNENSIKSASSCCWWKVKSTLHLKHFSISEFIFYKIIFSGGEVKNDVGIYYFKKSE